MSQVNLVTLSEEIAELKRMIAALSERVAGLEGFAPTLAREAAMAREEGISEDVLLAIAAALAAYLGKRPRIRQIRLLGSARWAQEGRVSIQASHLLNVPR